MKWSSTMQNLLLMLWQNGPSTESRITLQRVWQNDQENSKQLTTNNAQIKNECDGHNKKLKCEKEEDKDFRVVDKFSYMPPRCLFFNMSYPLYASNPKQWITMPTLSPELRLLLFSLKKKQPLTSFTGVGLSPLHLEGTQVHKNLFVF